MKKAFALLLALSMVLAMCGCGSTEGDHAAESTGMDTERTEKAEQAEQIGTPPAAEEESTPSLLDGSQSIDVGSKVDLSFGNLLVLEYGYAEKVEAYILVTRFSGSSTVNGTTTESSSEKHTPHYLPKKEDYVIFAVRGVITNTSAEEINLAELAPKALFVPEAERTLNIFTGKPIDDDTGTLLATGESSDVIFYTTVPIDQFEAENGALLLIDQARLGIAADQMNCYASIGFEEADGERISREQLLAPVSTESSEPAEEEEKVETQAGEPVEKQPATTGAAEGKAVKIENVAVGFSDTLPEAIRSSSQYKFDPDRYALSDSQVYAVIQFSLTNLSREEIKVADIKDNFMVELNYNDGFIYSTDSETYCFFLSGNQYMFLKKNASVGQTITAQPLVTIDVTLYLPCAKAVSTELDDPLVVTFLSTYAGRESFDFVIR